MIKMIAGVYGLPVKDADGKTRVVGMGPASGPFSIDTKREAELVAKKVAVYVDAPAAKTESKDEADTKSFADLSVKELRELGKEHGLTFRVGMTKMDMIEALETAQAENKDDADEDAGSDAPSFDPAAAVQ